MRAGPDKYNHPAGANRFFQFIDQEEIAANMAFARARPIALKGMVLLFWSKRAVPCNQKQHCFFWQLYLKCDALKIGKSQIFP
jgi:hypothetical protein